MNKSRFVSSNEIRSQFAAAMSEMYRNEVPMYGTLLEMVRNINQQELSCHPELKQQLQDSDNLNRLNDERHGAIRLGKAEELQTMRRLFAVMGMYPVGYYDLSVAGIPVHSTAFRPLQQEQLDVNPFRIFTSLLRLDLIENLQLREQAQVLLEQRNIFTPGVIESIHLFEKQHGLNSEQASQFISEAQQSFRWHKQATVNLQSYQNFLNTHRLVADIVCFKGPHINHLTPRTLNIDKAQQMMLQYGLDAKTLIEGPPHRQHPILLRQTSFKALDEAIEFIRDGEESNIGSHSARFGEIEQRGQALTPKGRKLYDRLLAKVQQQTPDALHQVDQYYQQLERIFSEFPDDLEQIRLQGLGYFSYQAAASTPVNRGNTLTQLIESGLLKYQPITYEDFLPVSAAGIFRSNLKQDESHRFQASPNQQAFEQALGCAVFDEFELYARMQSDSLEQALLQLGYDAVQCAALLQQIPAG